MSERSNYIARLPIVRCDDDDWDLDRINADAAELRLIRKDRGVGAMLAHAAGVPLDQWRAAGGINRPAGR
jgi:hypothetical protein